MGGNALETGPRDQVSPSTIGNKSNRVAVMIGDAL